MIPKGFDFGAIMQQAQNLKKNIDNLKQELEKKTVEGSAGGGMVKALVSGGLKIKKVTISPEIFKENDQEMLEEMIVAAINDGINKAIEMEKQEMQAILGPIASLGLPDGLL